jgi:hypothetical protein
VKKRAPTCFPQPFALLVQTVEPEVAPSCGDAGHGGTAALRDGEPTGFGEEAAGARIGSRELVRSYCCGDWAQRGCSEPWPRIRQHCGQSTTTALAVPVMAGHKSDNRHRDELQRPKVVPKHERGGAEGDGTCMSTTSLSSWPWRAWRGWCTPRGSLPKFEQQRSYDEEGEGLMASLRTR